MKLLLLLLLLFVNGSFSVSAQSPLPENQEKQVDPYIREHNERRARNPEGLLFTVRIKDNRKQFHLGEVIPLELSFAASKPDTLNLDAATYDRSGRLFSDGFALDPRDGAVDPLTDYFDSGLYPLSMGGIRGVPDLTDKPYLMTAELNEWQRIDSPGHYRMYVVSNRVGRKGASSTFLANGDSPAISNVIEFDVLPADKKWARQKLNETIAALSKTGDDHRSACRALRFLGTPEAAIELRKRFRGDDNSCEWQFKFGLIGSPHRDFVIRDMENAISLREQPITSHFINTLALLEFTKRAPAAPPYPSGKDDEQISQWQSQMDARRGVYDKLRLHYVRQLVTAIPQKQREARATSLQTLLDFRSEITVGEFSTWSTLLALMPEVFNRLPLDEQARLLQYQWKPIASPAMLPVLRAVFNYTYPKDNGSEDFFGVFPWEEELRGAALRRIYELSPEEGRRLIVAEIRRPKPRVNQDVLSSLPDETLPELNTVLIGNLEGTKDSLDAVPISQLIERYASDEILARVQAVYESRDVAKLECRTQAALLAYFLRVAPSQGRDYLNKALSAKVKGHPRCYAESLKNVAKLHMSVEVMEVATEALDNENSFVVSQAAGVLAEYGNADAEKALWQRFEKWHQAMQSQGEELNEEELSNDQKQIEEALREALTRGQAWLADPEKLKRVRDLCITDKCSVEVDRLSSNWDHQIYVALDSFDPESFRIYVANCELKSLDSLKKKLLQFPKGTEFKLTTNPPRGNDAKLEEAVQQIKSFLKEHGMSLKAELEQ